MPAGGVVASMTIERIGCGAKYILFSCVYSGYCKQACRRPFSLDIPTPGVWLIRIERVQLFFSIFLSVYLPDLR